MGGKYLFSIVLLVGFFFCGSVFAQHYNTGSIFEKEGSVSLQKDKEKKDVFDVSIEISTEYQYLFGEQTFEVVDSQERKISKLEYPIRGGMFVFKGEVKVPHTKISLGGRYGISSFKRTTSTDTDWLPSITPLVWWQSNSQSKTKVEFFDINVYYRLLDLDENGINEEVANFFKMDRFSLDVFAGYQQQIGRYRTTDLVDVIEWWLPVSTSISGQNSFYKAKYKGPRIGFRLGASRGEKISAKLSFSYALIETKGYGWWNLREYSFWEEGDNGSAFNVDIDTYYHLTPNWFIGAGFHYVNYSQNKLTEAGRYNLTPASNYDDLDIIRNVDYVAYGPSFMVGFKW